MIRINLLAGPRARKIRPEWDVRAELALAVGLVVLTLGACFYYSGMLDQEIEARHNAMANPQPNLNFVISCSSKRFFALSV